MGCTLPSSRTQRTCRTYARFMLCAVNKEDGTVTNPTPGDLAKAQGVVAGDPGALPRRLKTGFVMVGAHRLELWTR